MARLILLRHGSTSKAENDLARSLTAKGVEEVLNFKRVWMPYCQLVISSPADRTICTGLIASDGLVKVVVCEELYAPAGAEGEEIDRLYETLGNRPLVLLMAKDETKALVSYGARAYAAVARLLEQKKVGENDWVLVSGHTVLLQTLALKFAEAKSNRDGAHVSLTTVLNPAEALAVNTETGGVLYWKS